MDLDSSTGGTYKSNTESRNAGGCKIVQNLQNICGGKPEPDMSLAYSTVMGEDGQLDQRQPWDR
jgi:hypothetical protein